MTPKQLRSRRLALGMTQEQLAAALGYHPNTIARWERGELTIAHPESIDATLKNLEGGFRNDESN